MDKRVLIHKFLNGSYMDADGDQKNKISKRERNENSYFERRLFNVGAFLQSFWVRCRSIFPNITDGKFMESELRFVFYCGVIFWFIYLFYQVVK